MSNDSNPEYEKRSQRIMWMATGAVILFILGLMGANVMFHKDTDASSVDASSQSRSAPTAPAQ